MMDPDPKEYLSDLLSDLSRLERRNLLLASTTGILVSHVGLVPTRISALGIELSAPAQGSFLVLVALVVSYFVLAFVIYALADFFFWRKRYYDYLVEAEIQRQSWSQEDQDRHDDLHSSIQPIRWYYQKAPWVAKGRAFFDFVFPIIVALYSVSALLFKAWR